MDVLALIYGLRITHGVSQLVFIGRSICSILALVHKTFELLRLSKHTICCYELNSHLAIETTPEHGLCHILSWWDLSPLLGRLILGRRGDGITSQKGDVL